METTPNPPSLPPPAPAPALAAGSTETAAKIVYALYVIGLVTGLLTAVIGLIIAYVYQGDAPAWLKTHYRFQIRTFWIAILYAAIGALLTLIIVGPVVWVFAAVWLVVRTVKGFRALERREAIADVETWWW